MTKKDITLEFYRENKDNNLSINEQNIINQLKDNNLTTYQLKQYNLHVNKSELFRILSKLEKSNIIKKISEYDNRTGLQISTYKLI